MNDRELILKNLNLNGITVDITKFFDTLDKCVAITDAATYELVYLNQAARNTFDIKSLDDINGKKCYEIFNGLFEPCPFCMHKQSKIGEFRNRPYKNLKLNCCCVLHDTLFEYEGRLLHFEMLSNIDNQRSLRQIIQQMNLNDRIVNEAVSLALAEDNPDKAIYLFLQHVGESLHAARCYIFERMEDNTFDNTYEWCREDETPQIDNLKGLPWEKVIKPWYDEFDKHRNIVITDIEAYKKVCEPMYNILKPQGIKCLVVAPLVLGNKRIGFYGVDNPPPDALHNVESLYKILGDFMAAMLQHRDNMRKLEYCSTMDQLTGVSNRRALSMYFNNTDRSRSLGLIFCDINGLKKMNDEYGHTAGDGLIKRAVRALRNSFEPHRIFRMGGDEFLCIRRGCTREELDDDIAQIRESCRANDVSMAIGAIWQSDDSMNFDKLFKMVDAEMYRDKRKFYGERRHSNELIDPTFDEQQDPQE